MDPTTAPPMLRAPSRRGHDVAVSPRGPAGCPRAADRVAAEALGAGCPEPVAPRVRACILHSGRYDCFVSFLVVRPFHLDGMRERLARVGTGILVLDADGREVR